MHANQDTVLGKIFRVLYLLAFGFGSQSDRKFKCLMGIYSMIWERLQSGVTFSVKITDLFFLIS